MEKLLAGSALGHRQVIRLQVVLNRADGQRTSQIASTLRIRDRSVSEIVGRFNQRGLQGLLHQPSKKPGKAPVAGAVESELVRLVKQEKPKSATHWSTRALAKRVGISHTKVHQILVKHQLKPHLVKTFRTSNDPQFREKLEDIVGLYLDPPQNAVVLCVDEKSQIQALQRTQPILPLREGIPERQTHDYHRHGVTTLFAALEVASGKIIGRCMDRHRHHEYLKFLRVLDRRCQKGKVLHLIVDNVSSHKTKSVQEFLQSKPKRFVVHYTPTHASWLNMIERWFAEITTKRIRRESWDSVRSLKQAIMEYVRMWNRDGRKFVWTKSAGQIMSATIEASAN